MNLEVLFASDGSMLQSKDLLESIQYKPCTVESNL